MKRTLLLIALLTLSFASADAKKIFSISSGPGEDASKSIVISWAADTTAAQTYLLYTTVRDKDWKQAKKVMPQQEILWTAYDDMLSADANNREIVEHVKFIKCGVALENLKKDTEYKYVIKEEGGEKSREGKFKTAGAREWSCAVISDIHSCVQCPNRIVAAMGVIDKIEEIDPSTDWVLSAGDVVAWGGSYSFWKRFFEEDNCASLMWARANGNHDNWTKASSITRHFDIPNDYFLGTSFYPRNGYMGQEGVCYHFRYGNTLFIMLNSEDLHDGAEFDAAAQWTKEVIRAEKAGKNPPEFTVAVMHYEWFIGTDGRTSMYRRWHEVFDEVGVDLAIAGNNHVYVRTHPLYKGEINENGTVYLQTPSSDNERGRAFHESRFDNSDKIKFRWSQGKQTIGAVHMSVNGPVMNLELIDRNGQVIDSTTIHSKTASNTR